MLPSSMAGRHVSAGSDYRDGVALKSLFQLGVSSHHRCSFLCILFLTSLPFSFVKTSSHPIFSLLKVLHNQVRQLQRQVTAFLFSVLLFDKQLLPSSSQADASRQKNEATLSFFSLRTDSTAQRLPLFSPKKSFFPLFCPKIQ